VNSLGPTRIDSKVVIRFFVSLIGLFQDAILMDLHPSSPICFLSFSGTAPFDDGICTISPHPPLFLIRPR